jgi:hypothetical protein
MENLRPPFATCADDRSGGHIRIDWHKVEVVADVRFESDLRDAIENELNWHSRRWAEYARDADVLAYRKALEALAAIIKAPSSKDRTLPIEYELGRVFWFLEIMSQPLDAELKTINADYFLYSQIWTLIGKAGIRLTRGKGLPKNRLLKAQRVFQEICAQAGITFSNSDQALAQALQRALKVSNPYWDK